MLAQKREFRRNGISVVRASTIHNPEPQPGGISTSGAACAAYIGLGGFGVWCVATKLSSLRDSGWEGSGRLRSGKPAAGKAGIAHRFAIEDQCPCLREAER